MQATLWLVLLALGLGLIFTMHRFPNATSRAVAIRVAASAFIGVGTLTVGGWSGEFVSWVYDTANSLGAAFGQQAFGTGAVWILWLAMSIAWSLTMLPESWFRGEIPDPLSISGVFLPALSAAIPGRLGDLFQAFFDWLGHLMVTGAAWLIGG